MPSEKTERKKPLEEEEEEKTMSTTRTTQTTRTTTLDDDTNENNNSEGDDENNNYDVLFEVDAINLEITRCELALLRHERYGKRRDDERRRPKQRR